MAVIPYKACAFPISKSVTKKASRIIGLKTRIRIKGNKKIASPAMISVKMDKALFCFFKEIITE